MVKCLVAVIGWVGLWSSNLSDWWISSQLAKILGGGTSFNVLFGII